MQDAITAVREGKLTLYAASKKFSVPRSTFQDNIHNCVPEKRKMGPPSTLTTKEENHLENWIIEMSRRGYPVSQGQLLNSVSRLVQDLGRANKFTNGKAGRNWYDSYMRKRPRISERTFKISLQADWQSLKKTYKIGSKG